MPEGSVGLERSKVLSWPEIDQGRNAVADTCTLESEIDRMVYKLYGLTKEEIKIVEGAS